VPEGDDKSFEKEVVGLARVRAGQQKRDGLAAVGCNLVASAHLLGCSSFGSGPNHKEPAGRGHPAAYKKFGQRLGGYMQVALGAVEASHPVGSVVGVGRAGDGIVGAEGHYVEVDCL